MKIHRAVRPFVLCGALIVSVQSAFSADFQLKGLKLGMDESTACGSAEVTDLQKTLDASSVTDVTMPASRCDVPVDSIAGIVPDSPLYLAFWKGRLVRVAATFTGLKLHAALSIEATIAEAYGKPMLHKRSPSKSIIET